ncbi:MAG: ECF transporter S component [Eubacteriales bacterium]|nr:ECF transporter S component [Eubacteriales bacterium]
MNWKLKDILMVGIIGVLFSFVFLGANYLGALLIAALTPFGLSALGYEPIYGLWFMAAIFASYIIQKKGVGIVAEMIASLIEVLLGSMFGPMVFLTGFVQGFGCELGFIITRYKRFDTLPIVLGSVFCAIFSYIENYFVYGYYMYSTSIVIAMVLIRIMSAIIFGLVAKALADGLAKAGVLRGYALGMKQAQPKEID